VDARTCEVGATLPSLNIGPWNDVCRSSKTYATFISSIFSECGTI